MSDLMKKMLKSGSIASSSLLSESPFFSERESIKTDLPILNIAFSGNVDGGLIPGLTILAGLSKSFKTLLALYCMKAYFNKYPDSICLFYDTEFGTPPDYLKTMGIDTSRVIHIPVEHVEQLKFDMVKRINEINRGEHVFIMVDSLGNLASKKEIDDAVDEKSVADMSRAKAIRSFLRTVVSNLTAKDLPCVIVNHIYNSLETYSKVIIPGGTAVTYLANQIFVISKSQEKNAAGDIEGWTFTINIEKSRFVKEKSKLPFTVRYKGGIGKYSGLLELALDAKLLAKPKMGWYAEVDQETGEIIEPNLREKDLMTKDSIWEKIIANPKFNEYLKDKFQIASGSLIQEDVSPTLEDEE